MRPTPNPALAPFGTTVFSRMSALAAATGAINLGQGFPDEDGPAVLLDTAAAALHAGRNQYPNVAGDPQLRAAIAEHQRQWYGIELDSDTEVLVTAGATEAIAASLLALCEPGDEVIALEPTYDSYAASIALAGARLVPVRLRFPEHRVDLDAGTIRDGETVVISAARLTDDDPTTSGGVIGSVGVATGPVAHCDPVPAPPLPPEG